MNKLFFIFLLEVGVITCGSSNVSAMGYGQQQPYYGQPYGHPYAQPYGQSYGHPYGQPYGQSYGHSCSRQALEYKRQQNAMECQQEMQMCHQSGDHHACQKAQNDCSDVQKYAALLQHCPYP